MTRLAHALLYCLLIWAPLLLGSNRPIFWTINAIAASVVVLLFLVAELRRPLVTASASPVPALVACSFAGIAVWMVIQSLPGVPEILRHPFWAALRGAPASAFPAISINPGDTWIAIGQAVPIGFLALASMRLAFDRRRASFLLGVVVFATTAVAAYGLAAQYVGFRQVPVIDVDAYPGFLTGTFVGRNAAATYFVLGLATAASWLVYRLEDVATGAARSFLSVELMRQTVWLLVACLVLAAALLNTGSRGGIVAGTAALITITVVALRRAAADRPARAAMFAAVLAAIVIVAAVSSDVFLNRLSAGVDSSDRVFVYRDTIDMIIDRPLLGHGAGTYADAFPLYHRRAPSSAVWNRAHNSYLQAIAELGIPAALVLFGSLAAMVAVAARRLTSPDALRPVSLAATASAVAVAFHSLVDFSIQIQAVGLTFIVLLGAGVGEAIRVMSKRDADENRKLPVWIDRPFAEREVVDIAIPNVRGPV